MDAPSAPLGSPKLAAAGALVATIALGVLLRLVDPLSSAVIPAEDPYTHMVLVREHLRTGTLDPLNPPGGLYPPGMHAFMAAVWSFSGLDLYELFRWAPVALGGLGVLGMGLALWRHAGPVAGFVGALGFAVAPEVIFRTTMMSPTALDMALVPFCLLALLELARGHRAWFGVAAPMVLFFVFAHPWLLAILTAGVGGLLLYPVLASSTDSEPMGLALVLATVGAGFGLAMTGCGGMCGPGLERFLPGSLSTTWLAPVTILGSMLPAIALALAPDRVRAGLFDGERSLPPWGLALASLALTGILAGLTIPALQQGLPQQVDLPRMLGWPLLALAAFAVIALPFLSNPAAYLGFGIAVGTYPMVLYNLFNSPFWPHRTVVFLGVGLVLLAGVAAAALARWAVAAWGAWDPQLPRIATSRPLAIGLIPALLVTLSLGGAVYAGTPDGYDGGWYRLYQECELDAFETIAEDLDEEPDALVVTGSWQSRLVLAALTEDPSRVWASSTFFWDETERDQIIGGMTKQDRPLLVLTDRHLQREHPNAETGFLDGESWVETGGWCASATSTEPRVGLHRFRGGPT